MVFSQKFYLNVVCNWKNGLSVIIRNNYLYNLEFGVRAADVHVN